MKTKTKRELQDQIASYQYFWEQIPPTSPKKSYKKLLTIILVLLSFLLGVIL